MYIIQALIHFFVENRILNSIVVIFKYNFPLEKLELFAYLLNIFYPENS